MIRAILDCVKKFGQAFSRDPSSSHGLVGLNKRLPLSKRPLFSKRLPLSNKPVFSGYHHKLLVSKLPPDITEEMLEKCYSKYGEIRDINLMRNGCAFVYFANRNEIDKTLKGCPRVLAGKLVKTKYLGKEFVLAIKSLLPTTTKKALRKHFSKFGTIRSCVLKKSKETKESLGVAYICFDTQQQLDAALNAESHVIDEKEVDFKNAVAAGKPRGLLPETTYKSLLAYFSQFGNRGDKFDKETGKARGSAFIAFSTVEEIDKAIKDRPHVIADKLVKTKNVGNKFGLTVKSLLPTTSEESLCKYFSKFGTIRSCVLERSKKTKKFLGVAYIRFDTQEQLDAALNAHSRVIDEKEIKFDTETGKTAEFGFVTCSTVKEMNRALNADLHKKWKRTLIVEGLSPETPAESLVAYFSQFGKPVYYGVKSGKKTGKARGFGSVTFSTVEEMNKALNTGPHIIDGREVILKLKRSRQ